MQGGSEACSAQRADLANYLVLRSLMFSLRVKGKSECAVPCLVHATNHLVSTSAALINDLVMRTINSTGAF